MLPVSGHMCEGSGFTGPHCGPRQGAHTCGLVLALLRAALPFGSVDGGRPGGFEAT